jgi:hypothetical protein
MLSRESTAPTEDPPAGDGNSTDRQSPVHGGVCHWDARTHHLSRSGAGASYPLAFVPEGAADPDVAATSEREILACPEPLPTGLGTGAAGA